MVSEEAPSSPKRRRLAAFPIVTSSSIAQSPCLQDCARESGHQTKRVQTALQTSGSSLVSRPGTTLPLPRASPQAVASSTQSSFGSRLNVAPPNHSTSATAAGQTSQVNPNFGLWGHPRDILESPSSPFTPSLDLIRAIPSDGVPSAAPNNGYHLSPGSNLNAELAGPSISTKPTLQQEPGPRDSMDPPTQHPPQTDPHVLRALKALRELETKWAKPAPCLEMFRIVLLRKALNYQDDSFILLHRVFCLRTVLPHLLPPSLKAVSGYSWKCIELILGPNENADPEFVKWCSNFMVPRTGDWAEQVTRALAALLQDLPTRWNTMLQWCASWHHPPLLQDMIDCMQIISPTLQVVTMSRLCCIVFANYPDVPVLADQIILVEQWRHSRHPARTPEDIRSARELYRAIIMTAQEHRRVHNTPYVLRSETCAFFGHEQILPLINIAPVYLVSQSLIAQQSRTTGSTRSSPVAFRPPPPTPHQPNIARITPPASGRAAPVADTLFPPSRSEPRPQSTQPNASRSALHQAHLRSPIFQVVSPSQPGFYRHVDGFVLAPVVLNSTLPIQSIAFEIPALEIDRCAKIMPNQDLGKERCYVSMEDTILYRVRVAALPPGGFTTESSWTLADTYWPDNIYISFNGRENRLGLRRKVNHGRDLPIDVTHLVQAGRNVLEVTLNARGSRASKPAELVMAVERICFLSYDTLRKGITRISHEESLNSIVRTLMPAATGSDNRDHGDDVVLVSESISVNLIDPFTSTKICETPVRGAGCLHRNCFDLDTFLAQCKRAQPNGPTVVDCWRCPICRGDVRPQMLVVDDFLVNVRKTLAERGLLDTRVIQIDKHGDWTPAEGRKAENGDGVGTSRSSSAKPIEVIEID